MDGKLVSILALMLYLSQVLAQGDLSSTETSETSSSDMVEDLKQRLEVTDAQVQRLISQNEAQEKQLESVTLRLNSIGTESSGSETVEDLKQRLKVTDAQMQDLISQHEAQEEQLESITLRLKTTGVAFSVTPLTRSPHNLIGLLKENTILKYDNIITNVGNAYDPNTGMFTAPVRGVYFFTFVLFNKLRFATEVKLMRNGEMVVSASDNQPRADPEDTTTNSATLLLETSDRVYIELLATKGIYTDGNGCNTFSGYLLYAM